MQKSSELEPTGASENEGRLRSSTGNGGFAGRLVTRWDLDKTYLRSDFATLRDLWRNVVERPDQKRPVPGASLTLAELGRRGARTHILSGSPEQLRRAILERLEMDGVRPDELTLKPNLQNLFRFRFFALRDQLGYKLPALLEARLAEEATGRSADFEVLVGDDSEADPFVYSLYADLVAGRVDTGELERILRAGELYASDRARTLEAAKRLAHSRAGDETLILIHLDRQTPPSEFSAYGKRLVPFFNYAQAALCLLDRDLLDAAAVGRVASELLAEHRFDLGSLARAYWDLRRRGHVGDRLLDKLRDRDLVGEVRAWPDAILADPLDGQPSSPPPAPPPLDYVALARAHAGGRNRS